MNQHVGVAALVPKRDGLAAMAARVQDILERVHAIWKRRQTQREKAQYQRPGVRRAASFVLDLGEHAVAARRAVNRRRCRRQLLQRHRRLVVGRILLPRRDSRLPSAHHHGSWLHHILHRLHVLRVVLRLVELGGFLAGERLLRRY